MTNATLESLNEFIRRMMEAEPEAPCKVAMTLGDIAFSQLLTFIETAIRGELEENEPDAVAMSELATTHQTLSRLRAKLLEMPNHPGIYPFGSGYLHDLVSSHLPKHEQCKPFQRHTRVGKSLAALEPNDPNTRTTREALREADRATGRINIFVETEYAEPPTVTVLANSQGENDPLAEHENGSEPRAPRFG